VARLLLEFRGERREIPVQGTVTIGRSKTSSIPINDLMLSRSHTLIYSEGDQFFVRDMNSRNGTFVNGILLHGPQALKSGDRIRVGPAYLTFFLRDRGDDRPATAPVRKPVSGVQAAPVKKPASTVQPARARPRTPEEVARSRGPSATLRFLIFFFLLGVVVCGTYVFKIAFLWLFNRFAS
jgi:pSer/pThr/pTyr-binding forkhead associated (FHA) protein